MNKNDLIALVKKNYITVAICVFILAALLLAAGMFSEKTSSESDVAQYGRTLEARLSAFLGKMTGVGRCEVFLTLESAGADVDGTGSSVRGVAVLCEGGASAKTKAELTDLLCRVLGLPQTKIIIGILN